MDSTTLFDTLVSTQAQKEAVANALLDAVSAPMVRGRRDSTTAGATWGIYGGNLFIDGARSALTNTTQALTTNATNYLEMDRAGTISVNTTGWTAGKIRLYKIVVNSSGAVTSYEDHRLAVPLLQVPGSLAAVSMSSDANKTLSADEAACRIIQVTSSVSLSAMRDVVVPITKGMEWIVYNNTTGSQILKFVGATGSGIEVGNAKRAILYADGTNIVRVTADNP